MNQHTRRSILAMMFGGSSVRSIARLYHLQEKDVRRAFLRAAFDSNFEKDRGLL